jgi:putative transposase
MARSPRLILPHMCHHAVQRGNNRQDVFNDNDDRRHYLDWAKRLAWQYPVAIIGYCLMTNHIHLLVLPQTAGSMINFMKLLSQRYSQYFNRKYHRSGKLWENRYKAHPVDDQVYYVVLKYIEMNPVRAGLTSDGASYEWSSAPYHLLGIPDPVVTADYVHSSCFSYREFFYEQELDLCIESIRISTQQGRAWGRPEFLEALAKSLGQVVAPRGKGRPKNNEE